MASIRLEQLAHAYLPAPQRPEDFALQMLDHVWEDGGSYALLGPSGCGKTTLLNLISGLLQPSRGRVLFDGRDVTALPPQQRNIAQVFQFPVVYDTMSVFDNLAFPLRNRRLPENQVRRRVLEVAAMLELDAVLACSGRGLGADIRQLVSMGRGLVREDVAAILFDEPLTVVDPHFKWRLRGKLREVHARLGTTMVYVTHDQTEALTFADTVVVMNQGRVLQIGTPRELFETPAHTFVGYFIGSPGMNLLPLQREPGAVLLAGQALALDPALATAVAKTDGTLELGIRPEFAQLLDQPLPGARPVTIERVQDMGDFRLVEVGLGPHRLTVRLGEGESLPSAHAWLQLPPERIGIYADGWRLQTGDKP